MCAPLTSSKVNAARHGSVLGGWTTLRIECMYIFSAPGYLRLELSLGLLDFVARVQRLKEVFLEMSPVRQHLEQEQNRAFRLSAMAPQILLYLFCGVLPHTAAQEGSNTDAKIGILPYRPTLTHALRCQTQRYSWYCTEERGCAD